MVTLKQIAANLNLSVMAVSKALRDAPDIGAATKEKVKQEARRLGYIPNHTARSLRGGASKLIGLIVPSLGDTLSANILSGLEAEAAARDYQILASSSQGSPSVEMSTVYRMLERNVEALFIMPLIRLQHRSPLLDAVANYDVPLVFVHQYPADAAQFKKTGWVASDGVKGCEMAVNHLTDCGHKNILYFSGPVTSSSSAEHMTGFRKAMIKAGLQMKDETVFMAGLDIEGGKQAMVRALAEEVPFSAIVCVNDAVALGAIHMLRQNGYRVPEDVSVTGFGDGLMAANFQIPLTTIRAPQVDMGRAAFNLWWQWKEDGTALGAKVLPVELIRRQSTTELKAREISKANA